MTKEIWKDIPDYEGLYQISNLGRIKSLARAKSCGANRVRQLPETILKPHSGSSRYLFITLHKDGTKKHYLVHRLVAKVFAENPNNLPQVNHKDENIFNNCVDNLEWCTNNYNQHYGTRIDRAKKSSEKLCKKIKQYDLQDNYIRTFNSISDAAKSVDGSRQNIIDCLKNKKNYKNRTAYGYKWKYEEVVSCR